MIYTILNTIDFKINEWTWYNFLLYMFRHNKGYILTAINNGENNWRYGECFLKKDHGNLHCKLILLKVIQNFDFYKLEISIAFVFIKQYK